MDMMRTGINSIVLHFWYHQVRCIEFKLLIGIGAGSRKIISPGYRVFDYTFWHPGGCKCRISLLTPLARSKWRARTHLIAERRTTVYQFAQLWLQLHCTRESARWVSFSLAKCDHRGEAAEKNAALVARPSGKEMKLETCVCVHFLGAGNAAEECVLIFSSSREACK